MPLIENWNMKSHEFLLTTKMFKLMKREFMISLYFILSINLMQAQVTIGSGIAPNRGVLLDLKENDTANGGTSASKGLLLPRVSIINLTPTNDSELAKSIGNTTDEGYEMNTHTGLVVYNTNTIETTTKRICPGVHYWNGEKWISIKVYPEMETKKELEGKLKKVYNKFNGPTDPMWTQLGKNPQDYPIGATSSITMKDADLNIYNTQRYYVGYVTEVGMFKTSTNVSCTDVPKWILVSKKEEIINPSFLDGVWTVNNVYSTQKATGGAFSSGRLARLNPAYYNSTNGAIEVSPNAMPSGTIKYGANVSGVSKNMTSSPITFAKEFGLMYSWADAMEVCSSGWHLPSNYEWDGVVLAHGGNLVASSGMRKNSKYWYTSTDSSTIQWGANDLAAANLGFLAVPSGFIDSTGKAAKGFGYAGHWWASSDTGSTWYMLSDETQIFGSINSGYYQSVRCVKD